MYKMTELENQLDDAYNDIVKAANSLLTTDPTFKNLEQLEKYEFAVITASQAGESEAEKTRQARTTKEHREFLTKLNIARANYIKDKILFEIGKYNMDRLRTKISMNKDVINRGI